MQMSYGTSIKVESIVDLEKTLSLPQIWKLKFTLCVSKSKDKKEGKCNFKRENNVNKESSNTCVNCPVSK